MEVSGGEEVVAGERRQPFLDEVGDGRFMGH